MRLFVGWADLLLFMALVGFGAWCVASRPWGIDGPSAASLAGALFGGAAVLLGNCINRTNERRTADRERAQRCTKLKAMITSELVNVAAGLLAAKHLMDAGVTQLMAGGAGLGQLDMAAYLPRPMPFTDSLGAELLTLDAVVVDSLTTLQSNLRVTRQQMMAEGPIATAIHGLSLTTATRLGNGLGHGMTILADVFEHISPSRMLTMPGKEDQPELVSVILRRAAKPPQGVPHPPQ